MTPPEGHLTRLEHAREEIAKSWLVRLIENSSLEEIESLPTDQIARELPELILDLVRSASDTGSDPLASSPDKLAGARRFADLAGGGEPSPARIAPHQSAESAGILAERLATAIEREAAPPEGPTVGVSIGVVACPEHGSEAEPLLELADQAMYRAKASGDSVALAELNGKPG